MRHQLMQVLSKEAPTVVEYLPLIHNVQGWAPCVSLYLPATHISHVPPSGPVYPATHRQLVSRLLPLREIEWSGHDMHALSELAPSVIEYLPATHSVHVVSVEAPAVAENLPAPHFMHVLAAEAPVCSRYVPDTHSMQMLAEEAPSVTEYLPASQSVHP
jgi:hypothetical protein